jgi:hypothetical protein
MCISETPQEVLGKEMKIGTMTSALTLDRRRMKQE